MLSLVDFHGKEPFFMNQVRLYEDCRRELRAMGKPPKTLRNYQLLKSV
jgi:hypothetical protein